MFAGVLLKLAADVEEADTLMIQATYSMAHPVVDSARGKKGIRHFARPADRTQEEQPELEALHHGRVP